MKSDESILPTNTIQRENEPPAAAQAGNGPTTVNGVTAQAGNGVTVQAAQAGNGTHADPPAVLAAEQGGNEVRETAGNGVTVQAAQAGNGVTVQAGKGVTTQSALGSANEEIRAGAAIALVAAMAAASKVAESKNTSETILEEKKGQGPPNGQGQTNGQVQTNPVTETIKDKRIKSLFLDNLHLFFGDTHLIPIREFINPSHQLNQHRDMITMNEIQRESYEHGRLLTLLKTMFFRESQGTISKEGNILRGGGITIEQLKNKIKKGISLIKPKT
jgi:hypothetical protein